MYIASDVAMNLDLNGHPQNCDIVAAPGICIKCSRGMKIFHFRDPGTCVLLVVIEQEGFRSSCKSIFAAPHSVRAARSWNPLHRYIQIASQSLCKGVVS